MEQKLRRDRRIGDNLRILRDRHDISQEKLCEELQRRVWQSFVRSGIAISLLL